MITITVSEKEILSRPNHYELGEFVHRRYMREKDLMKSNVDEHVVLNISESGMVTSIDNHNDVCVECGKITPYHRNISIDHRIGYIEGAGQGCFQPHTCEKYKELTRGLH